MDRKKRASSRRHAYGQLIETLESRQLLSASASEIVTPSLTVTASAAKSSTIEGYTPAQIKAAYGISSISFDGTSGNGSGETIAIVDAYSDPNIASDLAVFDKEFDLAAPPSFVQESAKGSTTKLPAENADWDAEISLDVEWAHAIAPDANIILVDASSDSMSGLMSAVEYARTIPTVSVISMSWGGSEFSGETSYDTYFTTPSGHIGITFVAASGDDGAAGGANYPASSPNVVSVGGTTLELTSTGTVESETAWSDSEGGVSAYESEPSYQSSAGISASGKSTPDVSYDANPDTGVAVYDSVSDDGTVGWQEVGGTSAGTPQWAALIAIADQGRVKAGLTTLTSAQTLDELYALYANPTDYAADFTDITSGSSVLSEGGGFGGGGYGGGFGGGFGGPFGGRFGRSAPVQEVSATVGYDTLTGIGTPKAGSLIETLATVKLSSAAVTKTATVTTASKTKTVKATKAAAAIEVNQAASVFGLGSVQASVLASVEPPATDVEVASTAAATTVAVIGTQRTAIEDPAAVTSTVLTVDSKTSSAAGDANGAAAQTLLAEISASISGVAAGGAAKLAQAEVAVDSAAKAAAELTSVFSDTLVVREFQEALNEISSGAMALPRQVEQSKGASPALVVAAAAVDAILIGYFHLKRKRSPNASSPFNENALL